MRKTVLKSISTLTIQCLAIFMISAVSYAQPGAPAFVLDLAGGTNDNAAILSVNLDNGLRSMVSDFGNAAQGTLGVQPVSLALEDEDLILVVDMDFGNEERGALFQVSLPSGDRQVISDFSDSSKGVLGFHPTGVALLNDNSALVVSSGINNDFMGGIFSVNVLTGDRTVVSDFNNTDQGPGLNEPFGIAVLNSNTALVMDATNDALSSSVLFSVNLNNGNRTVLSNFGDAAQGQTGQFLRHVAIGNSGEALTTDVEAGILFSVDVNTGNRTVVSNLSAQNPSLEGVVLENAQSALVVNDLQGTTPDDAGTLLRINLSTGTAQVVTDFGDNNQGILGSMPFGVIIFSENPGPSPQSSSNNSCALSPVEKFDSSAVNLAIMVLPLLIIGLTRARKK